MSEKMTDAMIEQVAREAVALSLDAQSFYGEANNVRDGSDLDPYHYDLLSARLAISLYRQGTEQPIAQEAASGPVAEINGIHVAEFQDWKGMDGMTAHHLIERHADDWAQAGAMMTAWLEANAAPPAQQEGADVERTRLDELLSDAVTKYRLVKVALEQCIAQAEECEGDDGERVYSLPAHVIDDAQDAIEASSTYGYDDTAVATITEHGINASPGAQGGV